jgi:serine/threonine protein kinase/tetratricopeptide (TPR) repeat protein
LIIGETAGHYRILERLGEGGMGEVYLAEDLRLNRKAAIKVIAPHLTRDEERRQRFLQEATLAAAIDHPHIAKIYDIDGVGDRLFIAMEYVRGVTLRDSLHNAPLTLRRVVDLAVQVGDALAKVHEHGIVHRDLKPENIIVTEDGYAKVIDFGLAKLSEPVMAQNIGDAATANQKQVRTADGVILGTVAYMSPEQARGQNVDARSDIFSFGALLHEMLSGVSPFRRPSAAETLSAILTETIPAVPIADVTVAPDLQRIVRKCLVKDPAGRYQTMRDVVVDLRDVRESLGSGEKSVTTPVTPATSPTLPLRKFAALARILAVIAVVALGAMLLLRRTGPYPAATTSSSSHKPAVAVVNFENVSGVPASAWLSRGLPSMLVTGLAQTPEMEVITSDRLNEAARQVGKDSFDVIEAGRLTEVARRAGATVVVNGSIIQSGDEIRIDARVEDLATGRVLRAESVRGKDPLALADDLATRIRRGLDVHPEGTVRRIADITSSSVEAYQLYSTAVQALRNVRVDEGRKLLNQAIALDPNFAMAYLQLSRADSMDGKQTDRQANLKRAAEHIDRLSERESLMVRASLALSEGRNDEALRGFEAVISKYPDEVDAYFSAVFLQDTPAKSIATMQRAVQALPAAGELYNILGYVFLADGRPSEAIAALETYVRLRPNESNALDSLAEANLVWGELDRALDLYTRAIPGGHLPNGRGWTFAVLGKYDQAFPDLASSNITTGLALARLGRYREAFETLDKSTAQAVRDGNKSRQALNSLLRSGLELERGDCSNVIPSAEAAGRVLAAGPVGVVEIGLSGGPSGGALVADLLIGTCNARSGKLDSARVRLEHAKQEYREAFAFHRFWLHSLEGEVALAEKDPARASAAFAAGEPPQKMPFNRTGDEAVWTLLGNSVFPRDGVARALVAQGRVEEAIKVYRALLTPGRDSKFTAFFEPRYILALARLLDRSGQKDAANAEYRRFLEYWKKADPALPEIGEARRGAG